MAKYNIQIPNVTVFAKGKMCHNNKLHTFNFYKMFCENEKQILFPL